MANLLNNSYYTLQKKIIIGYGHRYFFGCLLLLGGFISCLYGKEKNNFKIVFHSTTSFTNPGRISDSFCERDAIIALMKSVEKTISQSSHSITVIPLVKSGHIESVDAAPLINYIKPDLCIVFSAYKSESSIPECGIYWYTWSSSTVCIKEDDLIFVAEADAYRIAYSKTIAYANALQEELCASIKHWGQLFFASLPLIQLRGLIVPALLIEIGLPDESMADSYGILIGQILSTIA
jgi:hypothetical protein